MSTNTVTLLTTLLPTLLITLLAIYFFKTYIANENKRRRFMMLRARQKETIPLRIQAYERFALFLERISLSNLLHRVPPIGELKTSYASLLVQTIEQEYTHNLTQQIYVTDDCWNLIKTVKNQSIAMIRKSSLNEKTNNADEMREHLLKMLIEKETPTDDALVFLKSEVRELL